MNLSGLGAKIRRQAENDVFAGDLDLGALREAESCEPLEDAVDDELRRRGARGQPNGLVAFEPGRVEVGLVVDEIGSAPRSRATSTRRLAFELVREPTTSTSVASSQMRLTASWRFCVA